LRFVEELIPRVIRAGATGPKLLRADSGFENKKITARLQQAGWTYSIGVRQHKHIKAAIAGIPEQDWHTLDGYPDGGEAQIAQTMLGRQRLIVRRTRLVGAQAELWPDWRHHAFLTNRTDPLELVESEHRQHAVVELAIRDLKDQALAHFPSGKFLANAAWTVIAALAHNLRWTTLIGLPDTVIPNARHPPPTAHRPRPDHPHQPTSDTQDARPLALGDRVPRGAQATTRDASTHLTPPTSPPRRTATPNAGIGLPQWRPAQPHRRPQPASPRATASTGPTPTA